MHQAAPGFEAVAAWCAFWREEGGDKYVAKNGFRETTFLCGSLFVVCLSCGWGRGFAVHLLWGSV